MNLNNKLDQIKRTLLSSGWYGNKGAGQSRSIATQVALHGRHVTGVRHIMVTSAGMRSLCPVLLQPMSISLLHIMTA